MFAKNYYTLVAGLREYALDADVKGFDARAVVDEILEGVEGADGRMVRLHYAYYDCENLIAAHNGRSSFNELGNLTREQIELSLKQPEGLPQEVAETLLAYADPEGEEAERIDTSRPFEVSLMAAYYGACAKAKSPFLRRWAEFDRNLRNIAAVVAARRAGRAPEEVIVGEGDVAEQLQRSSAADFGLRGELHYVEPLVGALNDEENLLEKEHKIDLIRWRESSALAEFDYFNINTILSYLVRIDIVARWTRLDEARGREMFARLLSELDGKELINKQ